MAPARVLVFLSQKPSTENGQFRVVALRLAWVLRSNDGTRVPHSGEAFNFRYPNPDPNPGPNRPKSHSIVFRTPEILHGGVPEREYPDPGEDVEEYQEASAEEDPAHRHLPGQLCACGRDTMPRELEGRGEGVRGSHRTP